MKVSKGILFPVVELPGVGHMPGKGENDQEAPRVFFVAAAARATQRLVIRVGGVCEAVIEVAFRYYSLRSQATRSGRQRSPRRCLKAQIQLFTFSERAVAFRLKT